MTGSPRSSNPVISRTNLTVGLARRLGWAVADQAASSLGTLALTLFVAGRVTRSNFGSFALVFAAYPVVIGLVRSMVAEPLSIRIGRGDLDVDVSGAAGTAVVLGGIAGLLVVAAGLVAGGPVVGVAVTMGVLMPAAALQDSWRSILLARGRAFSSFANSLIWLLLQLGITTRFLTGEPSASRILQAWGAGLVAAAAFGTLQVGVRPRMRNTRTWLRESKMFWRGFLPENLVLVSSWQVSLVILTGIAGLSEVAGVRGAQTVLGPITLVFLALPLTVVPILAKRAAENHRGPAAVLKPAAIASTALAAIGVASTGVLMLVPADLGRSLLGDTWASSKSILVPFGLYLAVTGVSLGALMGLRAIAAVEWSVRVRVFSGLMLVAFTTLGAAVRASQGFVVGLCLASAISALLWWVALIGAVRSMEVRVS